MSSDQQPGGNQSSEAAPVQVDDLMEKFDRESRYLRASGAWGRVIKIIAIGFSCFQLYTAIFGVLEAQIQRPTHLMFALTLIYLLYPTRRGGNTGSILSTFFWPS